MLKVLTAVTDEVAKLAVGGSVAAVTTVFDTYTAMMKAHLTEEEGICVPLMRAYFDFKEVNKKVGEIMQVMDPTLMGAFVHHQGTKKEIQPFMAQERIPGFVWYVQFKGVRSKYRAVMKTHHVLTEAFSWFTPVGVIYNIQEHVVAVKVWKECEVFHATIKTATWLQVVV